MASGVAISFTVVADELKGLNNPAAAAKEATQAMDQHMTKLMENARAYPPPNSPTYIRTNTLFNSWNKRFSATADGVEITISNNAIDKYGRQYTSFVYGDSSGMGQRALHAQNGWMNLFREHMARQSQLVDAIRAVFEKFS